MITHDLHDVVDRGKEQKQAAGLRAHDPGRRCVLGGGIDPAQADRGAGEADLALEAVGLPAEAFRRGASEERLRDRPADDAGPAPKNNTQRSANSSNGIPASVPSAGTPRIASTNATTKSHDRQTGRSQEHRCGPRTQYYERRPWLSGHTGAVQPGSTVRACGALI